LGATPAPQISISDESENEGDDLVFTVSLSGTSVNTITVDYDTAPGTASSGVDYTTTGGTLTFNPGETGATLTITSVEDTIYELDETFSIDLSSPTNATLDDANGTGTIVNDDVIPAISINDASSLE
jgi:hypothetical protein